MKGIVQKNAVIPVLSGVLVDDGCFIGTNQELTVKMRSEYGAGERFVIPMEAFNLISNLPDEDVEITSDETAIYIKTSTIRNKFSTYNPDVFPQMNTANFENTVETDGLRLADAINNVIFAATDSNSSVKGIHMAQKGDRFVVEASDGHVLARDVVNISGSGMDVIIPKTAAKQMLSVGLYGKVKISFGKVGIQFETKDCTIGSQLYAGKYMDFDRIMNMQSAMTVEARRKDVQESVMRANACVTSQNKVPVRFDIRGDAMQVSLRDSNSEFAEKLPVASSTSDDMMICFDSKLTIDVLKSFDDENIIIGLSGKTMPSIWTSKNNRMTVVLLPVNKG